MSDAPTVDAIDQLGELLESAGARVIFDRGANNTNPCTFCGTRVVPGDVHCLRRIGTYPNGDPIRRPVCGQCRPIADARAVAAPPPKLPENVCPDCRLPRRVDGLWSEASCPKTNCSDFVDRAAQACLRIGLDKAHANEARMRGLLATVGEALDAAIAAQETHEPL